ncbi:hypothetical protein CECT5772_03004 [Streptococcus equi subsp. ruminatorum CECT 5772]|uniref:Uncharacterized protein n=1 Tax=Streptococcus equi subsp. ruminatorum CECT 5772 TaxID=1051981 RepID=A0A922NVG6_9STRE|nr:hypothetical protein CECT5772_03004 [Streptococcus equi subsp. ruminatorum CECT 5772]
MVLAKNRRKNHKSQPLLFKAAFRKAKRDVRGAAISFSGFTC